MKYLVWELVSTYDGGYDIIEYATWEEARQRIIDVMTSRRYSAETKQQYKQWLAGQINKIYATVGSGINKLEEFEIFITSMPLKEPIA